MAKTIHWQLPFVSRKGTRYRIDIYASGTCSTPVQLEGGEYPFVTDEDSSEDFFEAVRSHTGTLSVIDTDGTLMEQLMPTNDTDHPLILVNVDTNSIAWQGFLSCEAYSQSYVSRPQELSLNVKSVLDAMKSVNIELGDDIQFNSLAALMFYALKTMEDKADIGTLFDNIHIAENQLGLLTGTYIFSNPFFDERTIVNGGNTTISYDGNSSNDVLDKIAAFCGCVLRESVRDIYLTECSSGTKYYRITWSQAKQMITTHSSLTFPEETISTEQMSGLEWFGDGHKKTVYSGAKRVSVSANIGDYGTLISLPSIPYDNLEEYDPMLGTYRTYSQINTLEPMDSRAQCYAFNARYQMTKQSQQASGQTVWIWDSVTFTISGQSPTLAYANSILSQGTSLPIAQKYAAANNTSSSTGINQTMSVGAYFAKVEVYEGDEKVYHDTTDCLVISGCCTDDGRTKSYQSNSSPLFNIKPTSMFSAIGGWLNIKAVVDFIKGSGAYGVPSDAEVKMMFGLKFGNLYWNGTDWVIQTDIPRFQITMQNRSVKTNHTDDMETDEKEGWFIPLPDSLTMGEVRLYIFYEMSGSSAWYALISQLTVDYIAKRSNTMNERSSNDYSVLTGADFSSEKTINLSIASDAHNVLSPTIIRTETGTAVERVEIGEDYEHPEEHLIGLMKDYYTKPRRILSLETEMSRKTLPMVRFTGFDSRKYAPLAESVDWQQDKSTITCFELPED